MRVLILGATGRVGSETVRLARQAGHDVIAFVRDPAKFSARDGVEIAVGDMPQPETLDAALKRGVDAVVNTVGVDPLKSSTFVTDAARVVVAAMAKNGVRRYVGISGTAEMRKTMFGAIAIRILRMTPVRHAIRDHDRAFAIVTGSQLDWTLAGCPWIKDGESGRAYVESDIFPGGMKTIRPGNVADFLVKVIARSDYYRRIVGIWTA